MQYHEFLILICFPDIQYNYFEYLEKLKNSNSACHSFRDFQRLFKVHRLKRKSVTGNFEGYICRVNNL